MRRALVYLVVVPALLVGLAPIARAMPLEARREASNNAVEITYDDVTAAIEVVTEVSGIILGEKVRMWAAVVSDPAAAVGSRLLGNLRIYLRGDKAMSFDGIFKLVFLDPATNETTTFEATDAFVLRPQAGKRSRQIDFVFDMPSGTYLYYGRFKPAP